MAGTKPIPDGYHCLTAYMYLNDAGKAIDFYKDVFGARERVRMPGPEGTVGHAELEIGDTVVMLADAPDRSPTALSGTTFSFMMYVPDADATFKRAVDAGATALQPVENKFYGDRVGMVQDPFGHQWSIGTHVEDVSPEEMRKRMASMA